ncbi:MAG TPA: AI-2E family transporter [Chitinophagales bacterium]|jgi:AI-2 transport protein TqsA|nr:AI-2E family transporter [Chitinophagales bacterium]HQW78454.1 AI-2E family transporter [Chitinophagales bacterium]HRB67529.1 AI-2E family transporter [Chitinophagales bacterium]
MNKQLETIRIILIFFASITVLFLLHLLQELLVPLLLAMFIALLMQPTLVWFEKRKFPLWLSVSIIWIFLCMLFFLIGAFTYKTGMEIYSEKEFILTQVQDKLAGLLKMYNRFTGKEINLEHLASKISSSISSEFIMDNSSSFFGKLGSTFEELLLTAIYLVLILSGILKYENYLMYLGGEGKSTKYIKAFEEVKSSIVSYMKVKFIISLVYGLGITFICFLFGLQFALFWGFIGFILNFIPVFGAIIGLVPVFIMALIQFNTPITSIILIVVSYIFHFVLASVLEPIYMGNRISLNTIVIITGLLFWGYLWGIYGMFLSVPLMVLTKVILSQIEGTDVIVRLLGTQKE